MRKVRKEFDKSKNADREAGCARAGPVPGPGPGSPIVK